MITQITIADQDVHNKYYVIELNITNTVGLESISLTTKLNLILIEFDLCNRNNTSILTNNIFVGGIYSIIYYDDGSPIVLINKKCVSIHIRNSHMYDSVSLMFLQNK